MFIGSMIRLDTLTAGGGGGGGLGTVGGSQSNAIGGSGLSSNHNRSHVNR